MRIAFPVRAVMPFRPCRAGSHQTRCTWGWKLAMGLMSHHVPLCLLDGLPIVRGLQLGQEILLVLDLQQRR